MSDDLYMTRLRWSNGAGIAKLHGRSVKLQHAPILCGNAVHLVDYIPEIRLRDIRHRAIDRVAEMNDDETRAADALLRELTKDAPHAAA